MISVRNVSKSFGPQVVRNDVSLDFRDGETTAVIGPSGVGKSVLLKLIIGILEPDQGDILINDQSISEADGEVEKNRIRDSVGMLFQAAALFDSLTVYENVAFPLAEKGEFSRLEIHDRVVALLESLSLSDYAFSLPQQISIGMRKRVGLARALIKRPQIVLFDEPNTGLDPLVGQEVYDLIKLGREKWNFAGIVVSHELPEVFQVSDRVVMLLGGKVVFDGSSAQYQGSSDPAVQEFLHGRTHRPIRIQ